MAGLGVAEMSCSLVVTVRGPLLDFVVPCVAVMSCRAFRRKNNN